MTNNLEVMAVEWVAEMMEMHENDGTLLGIGFKVLEDGTEEYPEAVMSLRVVGKEPSGWYTGGDWVFSLEDGKLVALTDLMTECDLMTEDLDDARNYLEALGA